MRIGIDCDEVLFLLVPSFLVFLEREYNIKVLKEQITSFNFWEVPAFGFRDRQEAVDKVFEFYHSVEFSNVLPMKGSVEVVKKVGSGNSLYVITSRPYAISDKTSFFIDKYFSGLFTDIVSTNNFSREGKGVSKAKVLCSLECSLFIDDNYNNVEESVDANIASLLFRQPWNADAKLMPGIIPVNSWNDIFNVYLLLKHHLL